MCSPLFTRLFPPVAAIVCWSKLRTTVVRRFAAALEHATAQGALKALEKLDLNGNKIGDEGLRHLADALARGAAPALKELNLGDNPASGTAQYFVQEALKNRK